MDEAFIQALVDLAGEPGEPNGLQQLETLHQTARAKVLAGGGEVVAITSATINGKSVTQDVVIDAAKLFSASSEALRRINHQTVALSYADFSGC